jgi:hypothetical protein
LIEFGNDAAGEHFWINGDKKNQLNLGCVWDIDDATQAELGKPADSGEQMRPGRQNNDRDGNLSWATSITS